MQACKDSQRLIRKIFAWGDAELSKSRSKLKESPDIISGRGDTTDKGHSCSASWKVAFTDQNILIGWAWIKCIGLREYSDRFKPGYVLGFQLVQFGYVLGFWLKRHSDEICYLKVSALVLELRAAPWTTTLDLNESLQDGINFSSSHSVFWLIEVSTLRFEEVVFARTLSLWHHICSGADFSQGQLFCKQAIPFPIFSSLKSQ